MLTNLRTRQVLNVSLLFLLVISLLGTSTTAVKAAETRNIVILGTSDIHGNVDSYDYFTDAAVTNRGLTKIATYVKNVRASNPNTIVIDDGDTIQGTPLAYWAEILHPEMANPLAVAMKEIGYTATTVGNHEFNYGPTVFNKFQTEAWAGGTGFPTLSANVTGCRDYTFMPYTIKDVGGVQVGILGLTPPAVTHWERPENIVDCVFGDAMAAANHFVPIMKDLGADVIVVAAHTGLDEAYGYGREENFVKYLANEVPDIDVILAGHAHTTIPTAWQNINGVLVTEPNYHTRNISDIRITVTGSGDTWAVTTKSATTPAMGGTAEDAALVAKMKPYHDGAVAYINTQIGTATADFPGGLPARVADGPMADLINEVQEEAAAAAGFPVDASLAALFNNNAKLSTGPIKLKDAFAVYIYDNTLYVIEATGQMVKDELEWTATYFNQYFYEPTGVTINSTKMPDYNYDLWSGIEYTVDVTKPVGQRVVDLKLNGQPLAMDQTLRIALNNYRATGRAEFKPATILYQSTVEVRELITNWIMAKGTISPSDVFVQNYTFLPPAKTWLPANVADPVTRTDYAGLLWTAFDGNTDNYMRVPDDKAKPGTNFNRQEALTILATRSSTLADMWDPLTTDVKPLKQYTDFTSILGWAKPSIVFTTGMGIFNPTGNQILPKQLVTNAEALAWVREARYPLFTFVSTNDMHGFIETGQTLKVGSDNKPVGGAAYNMTYINNYKALNPFGTLLMDGGDMMQGRPISNLLAGESVIDVYNHMGYDAAVVGNHEFDWKIDTLQARMAQAGFPILVANIFNEGTDVRPDWAVPTTMLTVKGQQVGVIGVTSIDTPSIVMAGNLDGYEFKPVGPIVAQLTADLRAQGADLVVVLAHMPDVYKGVVSGEILDVAQPGVDLIISGHSHSGYSGKIGNVPIIQQYSSGTAIGVSDLRYDRFLHNIATSTLQVVTTFNEGMTPDAGIAALVAEYRADISPIVDAVVASTKGIISRGPDRYTGEVPMGDLIADAQRWKAGTQIGFMNPGGIRADIGYTSYPHDITWGDVFTVQPFDNQLMTMDMTGAQLYAVLEQQFAPTQSSMRLLQESGLKYTFDLSKPVGSRITSLTLTDGTPIDSSTTYTVTLNEYIGTGGDGFSQFKQGANPTRIGVSDLVALIDYIAYRFGTPPANTPIDPTVYPKIEGRIINATP